MNNPFEHEHTLAWGGDFLDLEALNKTASDAVIERIERVRRAATRDGYTPRASCSLILGPAGAGKTHLFARWRRALGQNATFVLVRPGVGVEITPQCVLREAVDALTQPAFGTELRQLDVVAAAVLAHARRDGSASTQATIDAARALDEAARRAAREEALDAVERRHPWATAGWLERLLRAPFAAPVERRALLTWLSGREPDDTQLERIGLREGMRSDEALGALRTLSAVAAMGAPLVLVFDQLENLVGGTEQGQVRAYASLVSELHDTVPGAVIVQMALDAEWKERIGPALAPPQRTRVEERRLTLALPRPEECEALVRVWIERLPQTEARGPFPAPFTEAQLRLWCTTPGVTPRQLMIACREALEHPEQEAPEADTRRVEPARERAGAPADAAEHATAERDTFDALWAEQLTQARRELDVASGAGRGLDESRLGAAIYATLAAAGLTQAAVADRRASHQLEVQRAGGTCRVFLLQEANGRSATAKLGRALEVVAAGVGSVLVLRERAFALPPSWKLTTARLAELRAKCPAAWHEVDREDAARMLALHDLKAAARSGDLTDGAGHAITVKALEAWVASDRCAPEQWAVVAALRGVAAAPDAGPPPPRAAAPSAPPVLPVPAGAAVSPARALLGALRVASVERLVREASAAHAGMTRREVLADLRAMGPAVRWFGPSIVAAVEVVP